jgi:hypothetical protein
MTPPVPPSAPTAPTGLPPFDNGAVVPELDPALIPNLDDLVTEDGAAVDNIFTEKQQRLLTESLYASWAAPGGQTFLALANVGYFHAYREPPLVPDMLLSLGVAPAGPLREKEGRSYFQWLIGKPPDVAIEIVSDRRGGEDGYKKNIYARQGVSFYVILDPDNLLEGGVLRAFAIRPGRYEPVDPSWWPEVGLGLRLWEGVFEGQQQTWLRWCDQQGEPIPTGTERADGQRRRAEQAEERIRRLEAQLRALGAEPEA